MSSSAEEPPRPDAPDSDGAPEASPESPDVLPHVPVEYCEQCGIPIDYCRFFGHNRGNTDAPDDDPHQRRAKPKPPPKEGPKPNIVLTVKARTKKKSTTTVANLEHWDINPRDFGKAIQRRLAIGCSTKATPTGVSVVIQGDAGQAVIDVLTQQYHVPKASIQAVRKVKKDPVAVQARNQPPPQPDFNDNPQPDDDSASDNSDGPPRRPPPAPPQAAAQDAPRAEDTRDRGGRPNRGGRGKRGRR
jgi:translation initiation factor 1 (eIF-1/SUI1)